MDMMVPDACKLILDVLICILVKSGQRNHLQRSVHTDTIKIPSCEGTVEENG